MNYMSVSFTHKNTDIIVREKLSFANDVKKREILKLICSNKAIKECLVLSTCNRVEVLAYVDDFNHASDYVIKAISKLSGVDFDELKERADIYEDDGAIHHLFSVASSLDSLVVGETQIVGQLKDAYNFAKNERKSGVMLDLAINSALKCAAAIRSKTDISKNPISVASVAVCMAREKIGDLGGTTAVVVGAGEMAELACKHLITHKAKVIIINRNIDHAKKLAESLGENASVAEFSNLGEFINKYALIFSATGANKPIITDLLAKPQNFKRYFFDIAVPRDIDITCDDLSEVYAVDDLEEIVRKNLLLREEQAQIAYSIVGRETTKFYKDLKTLSSTPIIKALRNSAKKVAETELKKAIKRGYLRHSDIDEARKLIHQVFKAFLHTPTVNLKNLDENAQNDINAIAEIFGIEEDFDKFCENSLENKNEI